MAAEGAGGAIPAWRHPGVSLAGKLANGLASPASPYPRLARLRYPEDVLEIQRIRGRMSAVLSRLHSLLCRPWIWSVREVSYVRSDGSRGLTYVHRPASRGDEPLPLVFWMHSGGFTLGTARDPEGGFTLGTARDPVGVWLASMLLLAGTPVVLASVDYRLAPEHPYPAAVDDCAAGLAELMSRSSELGFREGAVHLAGSSAGGNLAAVVMLELLSRGVPVSSVFLDCPFLDPACGSKSYDANASFLPEVEWLRWCWAMYLRQQPDSGRDARCCPLRQATLVDGRLPLPPVVCVTGLGDPLHDEGVQYAELLRSLGAPVTHVETRTLHTMWPFTDPFAARRAVRLWAELLRGGRGGASPESRL